MRKSCGRLGYVSSARYYFFDGLATDELATVYNTLVPTSVKSLNSAASASLSSPVAALTTGLISFFRPFTLFLGFAVAGASLSIKTVDRQSRNISKFDSSSEGIISSSQVFTGIRFSATEFLGLFSASRSPNKQYLVCRISKVRSRWRNSMLLCDHPSTSEFGEIVEISSKLGHSWRHFDCRDAQTSSIIITTNAQWRHLAVTQ